MEFENTKYGENALLEPTIEEYRKLGIEEWKKAIDELYGFYVEPKKNTTLTLEQVQWLSYIEEFCKEEPRVVLNKSKEFKGNIEKTIKYFNMYSYDGKLPSFDGYQDQFKKQMNDQLEAIFGKEIDLSIFWNAEDNGYEIDEEDLAYLMFLKVIYCTKDAENLICRNYRAVSDYYYERIFQGAKTLVSKGRIPNMTIEGLQERFDVNFGLRQRKRAQKYKEKLVELIRNFQIVESLIEECAETHQEYEVAEKRCDECITILDSCQEQLLAIRKQVILDNSMSEAEFKEFMREIDNERKKREEIWMKEMAAKREAEERHQRELKERRERRAEKKKSNPPSDEE